eukprot:gene12478-14644_t
MSNVKTVVDYLEVLELAELNHTVLILETVYRHVQYNSGPKYFERLKAFLRRNTAVYMTNELFSQTLVERDAADSLDAYQARRVAVAAQWYTKHVQVAYAKQRVVLLTQNAELLAMAGAVPCLTLDEYLTRDQPKCTQARDLCDSLTALLSATALTDSHGIYERYLPDEVMQVELKSGNIVSGKLHTNPHNRDEAFIKLAANSVAAAKGGGGSDKIVIVGKHRINRAIHGDKVGVALLPQSEWLDADQTDLDDEEEEEEEPQMDTTMTAVSPKIHKATAPRIRGKVMTGKVVGIFQRNWRDLVATMEKGSSLVSNYVFVVPLDHRMPLVRIPTKNAAHFVDKRVIVRIDRWDVDSNNPTGHFVSVVGASGSLETELSCLLVEHDISLRPWTAAIESSLPKSTASAPWPMPKEESAARRHMTGRTMSIDPLGSKDIDDAISIGYPSPGITEIGVHIADVSHFVKAGSPLDAEARRRGTTVYLPDRRYDMLPAVLSEDVCSLRGGVPRFAMSVVWKFEQKNDQLHLVDTWFGRTVIHSIGELHYQLAQDIIDGRVVEGKDADSDVTNGGPRAGYKTRVTPGVKIADIHTDLINLRTIYRKLRAARQAAGALDLESIEVRFQFDSATNRPDRIVLKSDLEVHYLVAEYMILANASVGTRIHEHYPGSALLRRHPPPDQLGFAAIKPLFDMCGFTLDTRSNKTLAESLQAAAFKDDIFTNQILKLKTVNVVSEAVYFSTGSLNVAEFYHYGLALDKYTHFTSPIRRYADIIVHRQLWDAICSVRNVAYEDHSMAALADHLNLRHRASKTVQRDATLLFQSLYFQAHPKKSVEAIVTDVRNNAFMVLVPEYGLRERVHLRDKDGNPVGPRDDAAFKSGVVDMTRNETSVTYTMTDSSSVILSVFDHILIDIYTQDNDYHLPPVKLEFVSILRKQKRNRYMRAEVSKGALVQQLKEDEKESAYTQIATLNRDQSHSNQVNESSIYNLVREFASIDIDETGNVSIYPADSKGIEGVISLYYSYDAGPSLSSSLSSSMSITQSLGMMQPVPSPSQSVILAWNAVNKPPSSTPSSDDEGTGGSNTAGSNPLKRSQPISISRFSTPLTVSVDPAAQQHQTLKLNIRDICSIKKYTPNIGTPYIIVLSRSGTALPPFFFENGGVREFIKTLRSVINLKNYKRVDCGGLNDVHEIVVSTSLKDFVHTDSPSSNSGSFIAQSPPPASPSTISQSPQILKTPLSTSHGSPLDVDQPVSLSSSPSSADPVKQRRLTREISSNILESFAKVSNFAKSAKSIFGEEPAKKIDNHFRNITQSMSIKKVSPSHSNNPSLNSSLSSSTDYFTPFTLSMLRKKIFYGGIQDSIRSEVWPFLLNFYPFDSTHSSREVIKYEKTREYFAIKKQWQSISAEQETRFAKYRSRKHLIDKDVIRTDRLHPMFSGDDNSTLTVIKEILLTYSFYNFDIGYVQGMSDLLTPIYSVMQKEVESFWCFTGIMERLEPNFHKDQNGMHTQLTCLSKLLKYLDPDLYSHFELIDGTNMYFFFQSILICFKREFQFEQVKNLWEVLWSNYLTRNLPVFMCLSILLKDRSAIIEENLQFDQILKFINGKSGKMDLDDVLAFSESVINYFVAKVTGSTENVDQTLRSLCESVYQY